MIGLQKKSEFWSRFTFLLALSLGHASLGWAPSCSRCPVANGLHFSLRRRFEQNQTDCAYTVIALLPTATENIVDALPVEELTKELQKKRAERLARLNAGETTGSDMSSVSPSLPGDDVKSLSSFQSEGYVHTSQLGEPADSDGQPRVKRNKTQLWNEVKITCMFDRGPYTMRSIWLIQYLLQL